MPNEQTSVPLYAASEILTAANMNISAGTGVPVFATTVTRDAAFGGASEKVLAEGQLCYLSSTNVVQYYDGAAWATVGPAAAASNPGLVCVKAETVFTAVASVTADSVFTSTYTNYLVQIIYTNTTTDGVRCKLRAGGTATSTNYNRQEVTFQDTTTGASRTSSTTSCLIGLDTNGDFKTSTSVTFFGPNLAQPTLINVFQGGAFRGAYTTPSIYLGGHNQSASTQFDGFQFAPDAGTLTGTYTVYGYSKAV